MFFGTLLNTTIKNNNYFFPKELEKKPKIVRGCRGLSPSCSHALGT